VIYGQGSNLNIQLENLALRRVLRTAGSTHLIDIVLGDSRRTVLAKDIQIHPTRRELIHVDFYEVSMTEKIVVDATLVPVGIAAPVAEALGTTVLTQYTVSIECLPGNLISEIEVDMALIETPDSLIHVSDLAVPKGVTVLTDPEIVVARFEYLEELAEEEEGVVEAEEQEVEVISRGKREEEEIEE
jgi:large subunit ribosomal protein L25